MKYVPSKLKIVQKHIEMCTSENNKIKDFDDFDEKYKNVVSDFIKIDLILQSHKENNENNENK